MYNLINCLPIGGGSTCTASIQLFPPQAVGQHFCVSSQPLSSSHVNPQIPKPPSPLTAGHSPICLTLDWSIKGKKIDMIVKCSRVTQVDQQKRIIYSTLRENSTFSISIFSITTVMGYFARVIVYVTACYLVRRTPCLIHKF